MIVGVGDDAGIATLAQPETRESVPGNFHPFASTCPVTGTGDSSFNRR
jgi:hypothetical protein